MRAEAKETYVLSDPDGDGNLHLEIINVNDKQTGCNMVLWFCKRLPSGNWVMDIWDLLVLFCITACEFGYLQVNL